MERPDWGKKHLCASCGARYYDMGAALPTCPKCGTVEVSEPAPKAKRDRKAKDAEISAPPKSAPTAIKGNADAEDDDLDAEIDKIAVDDAEDDEDLIAGSADLDDDAEDVTQALDPPIRLGKS